MTFHIIGIPFSAWGHTHPAIAFFVRLLKLDSNLYVTLITDKNYEEKCRHEYSRQLASEGLVDENRMNIVALETDMWQLSDVYLPHMKAAYSKIVNERPTQLVMVDLGFVPFFEFARPLAPGPIKLAAFHPIMNSLLRAPPFRYFHNDGLEIFSRKIEELMASEGIEHIEASTKCCVELFSGKCIDIAGFPKLSDYECYSQEPPFSLPVFMMMNWIKGLRQADVLVTSTAHVIEREGVQSVAKILKDSSGLENIFAVGPFLPALTQDVIQKEIAASQATGLDAFLDCMMREKGEKSVLYISFGSMFYPEQPAMVHTVLSVLLELGIPYILVQRPGMPPLTDELRQRMVSSTIAFVCEWAPQQYILSHPVTGWFLSHCGLNSVLESLALGVPIISWPLCIDQPLLSILVSQQLDCGFELSEVRQGFGLKYRESTGKTPTGTLEAVAAEAREVFLKAFFGDSANARARKIENAKKMANKLGDAWKEDGEAFRDAQAFLDFVRRPLKAPPTELPHDLAESSVNTTVPHPNSTKSRPFWRWVPAYKWSAFHWAGLNWQARNFAR